MKKKCMPYILLIPQIILTLLFLIGLANGLIQSLGIVPAFGLTEPTLRYYQEILTRPDMAESILFSLKIALISSVTATLGGIVICGICVIGNYTGSYIQRMIQLPVIVPHVVVALFIINIFSQNGLLARLAYALGFITDQQQFPIIIYNTEGIGIILAYVWKELPFIVYFVIAMMANINNRLGEAAINLGAGKWQAFFRITLPLCKNTIISGFLIIFVFALGSYELPLLLGATKPKALPILAYQQYIHPDLKNRPYAMALNGVVLLISLICAFVYYLLMKKNMETLAEDKK